mgnify:CR=1 FL=1
MSNTTFINNNTIIDASWLNDVNDTVYSGLGGATTPPTIRTALGLGTAATVNTGTLAGNAIVLDGSAKLPAVDGSQLTGIVATSVDVTTASGTLPVAHGGTGGTTASTARTNLDVVASGNTTQKDSATGASYIPSGTSAERPGSPLSGYFRFNTTLSRFEGYTGSAWGAVGGGGATGAGGDDVFYENAQTVTTDYTLTANKNAMSSGPITINSGVTVTVPSGATWTIV